jgi:hypothetical protein
VEKGKGNGRGCRVIEVEWMSEAWMKSNRNCR